MLGRIVLAAPRALRRGAFIAVLGVLALAAQPLLGSVAHADGPSQPQRIVVGPELRITTNRQHYDVGDWIRICFTLPSPGSYAIYDWQDGSPRLLKSGFNYDGHCFWGRVTPPEGYEYLQLKFWDRYGQFQQVWSAAVRCRGSRAPRTSRLGQRPRQRRRRTTPAGTDHTDPRT
jgi:hypothetical protein